MRVVISIALVLAAHFSLTVFVQGAAGKAVIYWPWAADTPLIFAGMGGLPQQGGNIITPLLAGVAGLCLLDAAAARRVVDSISRGWNSSLACAVYTPFQPAGNSAYWAGPNLVMGSVVPALDRRQSGWAIEHLILRHSVSLMENSPF
ncbi:MAG: hypothetical protein R3E39_22945 [Anaerolineae bacterium]